MFGTEIRRYFASQTAQVARETLKVEALQVKFKCNPQDHSFHMPRSDILAALLQTMECWGRQEVEHDSFVGEGGVGQKLMALTGDCDGLRLGRPKTATADKRHRRGSRRRLNKKTHKYIVQYEDFIFEALRHLRDHRRCHPW